MLGCSQAIKCYMCQDCATPSGARDCPPPITQCAKGVDGSGKGT